jgi:hypothetical protein
MGENTMKTKTKDMKQEMRNWEREMNNEQRTTNNKQQTTSNERKKQIVHSGIELESSTRETDRLVLLSVYNIANPIQSNPIESNQIKSHWFNQIPSIHLN